jgi:type II secretory pathway pseudopilin PulG
MRRAWNPEQGAVSLLTTIIISILLAIITTGLISLMISELRQSNDSEQSMRAYYAAQSGVEAGIEKVLASLAAGVQTPQTCTGAPSTYQRLDLDPVHPGAVGWTCQQISYSGSPSGSLPTPDKAVQVDLGTTANFRSMILEWDLTPRPSGGFPANFFNATGSFPAGGGWNHAAAMEMAIVDYQKGSFSASTAGAINVRNALVVPRTTGSGVFGDYTNLKGNNPVPGFCNPNAGSYHCRAVFNMNGSTRNFILRLRSRYAGTDYRLTFMSGVNGNGTVVNVPDGTATIDITAKAGDVYRRVVYKVPYEKGAASGLDYVIFSDQDVCKNFGVINGLIDTATTVGCPYN